MEPNKFRESRTEINRVIENLSSFIDKKELDASKACHQEVSTLIDALRPKAEGEIQQRSVRNLNMRVNALSTRIAKLKPKKERAGKKRGRGSNNPIVWDEEKIGMLSPGFLTKVSNNMGKDTESTVCFSATGKGVRPSYQVEFSDKATTAFSGSGHSPLKKQLPTGMKAISQPFSYKVIDSILKKKKIGR